MAESAFIKTTTFGGYDKADVSKRLEYLYSQVFELKNELRQTKLTMDEYKKGTDEEKAHESILASERAKLTMVQVQNESLEQKVKETKEENKKLEAELAALKDSSEKQKAELEEALKKLAAFEAGNDPASLSKVFIEAQKTAEMLVGDAKKQAEELETNSKTTADNMITEANNEAARIVFEAEKEAAEITAKCRNSEEQLKVASTNLKAAMLEEVKGITGEISKLKELFSAIEKEALGRIEESQALLNKTEQTLCDGGVPVFKIPEVVLPELPTIPDYKKINYGSSSEADLEKKKKNNDDLEKLLAMANAIGSDTDPAEKKEEKPANSGGAIDLEALMKQAEAMNN